MQLKLFIVNSFCAANTFKLLDSYFFAFLQIFPTENASGNALPIQLNERQPQADFRQSSRLKRQISNQDQQSDGIEGETLSPLMVRNFPPLAEEKISCM